MYLLRKHNLFLCSDTFYSASEVITMKTKTSSKSVAASKREKPKQEKIYGRSPEEEYIAEDSNSNGSDVMKWSRVL